MTRRLLVTGGCGFIGSNFVNMWLDKYPDDILVNVDRLDVCASIENVTSKNKSNYTLIIADINNTSFMLNILNQFSITHVVHFAAQTHVDNSFGNSISFTQSNILGTHSLLEACRSYGKLQRFFHMSTDEVYGEIPVGSFSETNILTPTNPYAATKAGAEFLVKSYGHSFGLEYVIARGNNVYGPRQYPEKVIPAFITALLENKKMKIQGEGKAIRMFLFVSDVVSAVETILVDGKSNNIYNIGKQDQYSVIEVANILQRRLKPKDQLEDWIEFVPDRCFNDCRYSVNTEKLTELGWESKVTFEEGLQKTIEWYEAKLKEV
jgi:dTDP-glucose 4,6-dehydratase